MDTSLPFQSLLERLKGATGPDRELDREIAIWHFPLLAGWPRSASGGWNSPEYGRIAPPEPVTGSIDAALALAEGALPGMGLPILIRALHNLAARPDRGSGDMIPRAVCVELLQALIASKSPSEPSA